MVLKISTISKSTGYWIVPSLFIYFTWFASENFRAARDDSLEIEQYSRAASARKEKIVDFLFALGGIDMSVSLLSPASSATFIYTKS